MIEAAVLRALRPRGVLFLCVANSARSQLAEGIARSLAPPGIAVFSAGSEPSSVRPEAVEVLAEIDIDIGSHHSKAIDTVDRAAVDTVITAIDTAIAATSQTFVVTLGGAVETGDTFSVTIAGTTVPLTVGGEATLAAVRDALLADINASGAGAVVTATVGFGDGEIVLTADDPAGAAIAVTVATTDAGAADAPTDLNTISVSETGVEAALGAFKSGLTLASTIAGTIQVAVDAAVYRAVTN